MRIVIPTYRRVDDQATLRALAPELHPDVVLVARPDEVSALRERHPTVSVVELPASVVDLSTTRQWILESFGSERFIMADDDIVSFCRRTWSKPMRTDIMTTSAEQLSLLRLLEDELDAGAGLAAPIYKGLMFSPHRWPRVRSAQNTVAFVMLDAPRLLRLGVRYDLTSPLEDISFIMQVLEKGLDAVVLQDHVVDAPMKTNSGGLQAEFSKEAREEAGHRAYARLMELWPRYVQPGGRAGKGRYTVYKARLLKDARARLVTL